MMCLARGLLWAGWRHEVVRRSSRLQAARKLLVVKALKIFHPVDARAADGRQVRMPLRCTPPEHPAEPAAGTSVTNP